MGYRENLSRKKEIEREMEKEKGEERRNGGRKKAKSIKSTNLGANSIKYLMCKHEELNLIPRTRVKNRACWYILVIPMLGSQEIEDP